MAKLFPAADIDRHFLRHEDVVLVGGGDLDDLRPIEPGNSHFQFTLAFLGIGKLRFADGFGAENYSLRIPHSANDWVNDSLLTSLGFPGKGNVHNFGHLAEFPHRRDGTVILNEFIHVARQRQRRLKISTPSILHDHVFSPIKNAPTPTRNRIYFRRMPSADPELVAPDEMIPDSAVALSFCATIPPVRVSTPTEKSAARRPRAAPISGGLPIIRS